MNVLSKKYNIFICQIKTNSEDNPHLNLTFFPKIEYSLLDFT